MTHKLSIPKRMELLFDTAYLLSAVGLGVWLLATEHSAVRLLWGIMALVLAFGDAFHLVPRMAAALSGNSTRYQVAMGVGKLLTSMTMTLFYLLLWCCGLLLFPAQPTVLTGAVFALAVVRVALCLLPQNEWTAPSPPLRWGIWRNVPFVLQGALVLWLFAQYAAQYAPALQFAWLAILLSFAFYLPVVLLAHKYPTVGMLMLPKSCAYLWLIAMGLALH